MVQVQPFDFGNTLQNQRMDRQQLRLQDLAFRQDQQRLDQNDRQLKQQQQALTAEQRSQVAQGLPKAIGEAMQLAREAPQGSRVQMFQTSIGPVLQRAEQLGAIPSGFSAQFDGLQEDDFFSAEAEKFSTTIQQGVNSQGDSIFFQAGNQGTVRPLEGVSPKSAESDASGIDADGEGKLRKEFTGLTKDFQKQVAAIGRVRASAEQPSAAGDLALIFNYMKILDPGSTVREGEFATAQNSGGVDDSIISTYNRIRAGQRLSEQQRADFLDRANRLFTEATAQHDGIRDQFISIAEQSGFDPARVVIQLNNLPEPPSSPASGDGPLTPEELAELQSLEQEFGGVN